MALYANAIYRGAHEGYLFYGNQASKLVASNAVADPVAQATATCVGIGPFPSVTNSHNQQPVQGIGSGRVIAYVPGRREATIRASQLQFADGTFLLNAVRNHAAPSTAGTVKGLRLFTCEYGTDTAYANSLAEQGIDCLMNTMRFDAAENQPLSADVEIWPQCIITQSTPKTAPAVAASDILLWQYLSWSIGGTDYHPILARVSVSVSNNLSREGMRQKTLSGGNEIAISRTPYVIVPHIETIQVQYTLRDRLPSTLRTAENWGAVTIRAEQTGTGAGRDYFQAVITNNFLNTESFQQAAANQQLSFTVDVPADAIALTAGVTT